MADLREGRGLVGDASGGRRQRVETVLRISAVLAESSAGLVKGGVKSLAKWCKCLQRQALACDGSIYGRTAAGVG